MTEELPDDLRGYLRPDVLTFAKPVGLPTIRARLIDEVPSDARATAPWDYRDRDPEVAAEPALRALDDVAIDARLKSAVASSLEDDRVAEQVLVSHDDVRYAEWSAHRHGVPTAEDAVLAESILAGLRPADALQTVAATDVADRFARVLKAAGLDEWSVSIVEDMAARASVKASERRVRVRAGATFAPADVDRLVAHEIGGHVLRSVNAAAQPTAFAALALGNSVETDEGLAIAVEAELGVVRDSDLRTYSARLLAVRHSATDGVLDVARAILPHVGLEQAVDIAIRVKRGMRDPNAPGGLNKDAAYLRGYRLVKEALAVDPSLRAILFATKWPLDHAELTRSLADQGLIRLDGLRLPDRSLVEI
jgi:hypothetical protein